MELVALAHLLWARRTLVALGVLLAVGMGMLAGRATPSGASISGLGSARMVLDTTDSQLVEAAPVEAGSLPMRAMLFADTLSTDGARATVARAAGVPTDQLQILGPSARRVPSLETELAQQVDRAVSAGTAPYVVEVRADGATPIISIAAHAPDPAQARKLAAAAVDGMQSLLVGGDGGQSGFVLRTVIAPRSIAVVSVPRRGALMVGAALATFGFWCGCVLLLTGMTRRLRAGAARPA